MTKRVQGAQSPFNQAKRIKNQPRISDHRLTDSSERQVHCSDAERGARCPSTTCRAIDLRFCDSQGASISTESGETYRNASTGALLFSNKGKCFSFHLWMYDGNKKTILNWKRFWTIKASVPIFIGSNTKGAGQFQLQFGYQPAGNSSARVEYDDLSAGERCETGLVGNWKQHDAYIWLGRGRKGVREPVAKVYCPPGGSRNAFQFEIALNMDAVLVTFICSFLDIGKACDESE